MAVVVVVVAAGVVVDTVADTVVYIDSAVHSCDIGSVEHHANRAHHGINSSLNFWIAPDVFLDTHYFPDHYL